MSMLTRPKTPDRRGRGPPTTSIHQSNTGKRLSAIANRRPPARSTQIQTLSGAQKQKEKNTAEEEEDTEVVPAQRTEPGQLISTSAYLRQNMLPCSDKFDPFASLPTNLNRFQEHLISFYLFHYPHATYGFNPRLKPHPVATNFTIALTTPACFQTILARAALYRGSLKTYGSDKEKKALELAMLRHKVEAIRLVHGTSVQYNQSKEPKLKDDLLASIMALGNLDRRSGSADSADMHYTAIRRLLKATGGPLAINNPMLNRVSVFFECIYGTSPQSYIWEKADFARLLAGTNDFLRQIRKVSNQPSVTGEGKDKGKSRLKAEAPIGTSPGAFCLRQETALYICLSKGPHDALNLTRQDRLELIWQLTCLLMLAAIVIDYLNDANQLQAYMTKIYKVVEDVHLSAAETSNNIMWLIQISDLSEEHSKRILRCAESAWISKHLRYDMQASLKRWLLQFLTGQELTQPFILDIYHFSYAI
jgi:hypothetical protein